MLSHLLVLVGRHLAASRVISTAVTERSLNIGVPFPDSGGHRGGQHHQPETLSVSRRYLPILSEKSQGRMRCSGQGR
jgi:hypothetical protein